MALPIDMPEASANRRKAACTSGVTVIVSRTGSVVGEGVEVMVHSAPDCTSFQGARLALCLCLVNLHAASGSWSV
jgi:hypothetical protein